MTSTAADGPGRKVGSFLHRHPRLRLAGLLSAPLLWLGVAYLGALAVLLISAFWSVNGFTGDLVKVFSVDNFRTIFSEAVYRNVMLRSVSVAAAVTAICVVLAVPMAFFMAKVASPKSRHWLVIAILTPLWASYLVKAYAWRVLLANGGPIDWVLGGPGRGPGYGLFAVILVLSYLWLPYMILPIYAGLERLPDSMLEASADLGARAWRTFRAIVLPILIPSIFAGSIFTFSLSLGDYIMPNIVGGTTQLIGNLIARTLLAPNQPLAAAFTLWPILIIVVYLVSMSKLHAFEDL